MDYYNNELYHWGVKGMKWGVRRFRKKDGGLTPEGKKRYSDSDDDTNHKKKKIPKAVKVAATVGAGLAVSYGGLKFSTNPHARAAVQRLIEGKKHQKVSDIIQDMQVQFVPKDGKTLSPSDILRLKDLGIL